MGGQLKDPAAAGEQRENWSNHCDFFLTSLGLAVGLGNVWRFPYVCYSNGQGTFLIPYCVMLVCVGVPGLFIEQSLGQYARVGVNKVYGRLAPIFRGFGYSVICIIFLSELYYAVICGWAFYYMGVGFQSSLPWRTCADGKPWHTPDCFTKEVLIEQNCTETYYNLTCTSFLDYCKAHKFEGYENGACMNTTDGIFNSF